MGVPVGDLASQEARDILATPVERHRRLGALNRAVVDATSPHATTRLLQFAGVRRYANFLRELPTEQALPALLEADGEVRATLEHVLKVGAASPPPSRARRQHAPCHPVCPHRGAQLDRSGVRGP